MSKIDDGGAAFPGMASDGHRDYRPGLTKRDYFAAAALTGLLAANATYGGATDDRTALAGDALAFADALLAAILRARQAAQSGQAQTEARHDES